MKTRIVLIGALAICVVMILSYFISTYYSEGAFEDWRSLGVPPYAIKEVAAVYFDAASEATIMTTTVGSDLFQQGALSLCSNAVCWEQVESIPLTNDLSELTTTALCQSDFRKIALPPSTPVWCANFSDVGFGTHFVREAHFAMLEDGDVWVWQFVPGMGAFLIIMGGVVLSAIFGLATLLILWLAGKRNPIGQL